MEKVIDFFKRIGKYIIWVLALIGGLFLFWKIRKAIQGKVKVKNRINFIEVSGEPDKIKLIKEDGSTEIVKLPDGVKFKEVAAAGITESGEIKVRVIHDKTNRRGSSGTNFVSGSSALDELRARNLRATDPS